MEEAVCSQESGHLGGFTCQQLSDRLPSPWSVQSHSGAPESLSSQSQLSSGPPHLLLTQHSGLLVAFTLPSLLTPGPSGFRFSSSDHSCPISPTSATGPRHEGSSAWLVFFLCLNGWYLSDCLISGLCPYAHVMSLPRMCFFLLSFYPSPVLFFFLF